MPWVDGILEPYRDEEAEVMDLIEQYFASHELGPVGVDDETPDDLSADSASLPFVRVGRVGGAPDRTEEHTDKPVVDVDVFAATRSDAKRIAQLIEQLLMSAPHPIDDCNVLMGPQKVEWAEGVGRMRRFYASYHLSLRR